ncbi:MAG TPA: type III secretion system cytoplasmic ring protein SctQ [Burkholderiaceae bacterium]
MNLADPPPHRLAPAPDRSPVVELGDAPALPRLDAALARAFNRLHDGRAPRMTLNVGGRDSILRWVYPAQATALPPLDVHRFRLGPHGGRLGLDVPALAALLGEARPARIPRALRAVLLADALAATVDALARATRLHFEWQPGDADEPPLDPVAALRFHLEDDGWTGALQFDAPGALDALAPPLASGRAAAGTGQALARLRLPVRFEIGRTRLRLDEVRGIARGDIVAIEEWRAAGAAVVAEAAPGGPAGPRFTALAEGSRITIQQTREPTMNRPADTPPAATAPESPELAVDRLDAIEVTLRFEVGDLPISLGDLRNVRAGHVFELGQPLNRGPVRIVAHGNLLGKGTLVAVGDRLGVRVSEFAPGDL